MKTLAVSYDNEFRTEPALINMRTACEKLNIKLIDVRSKRDIAQKRVKFNILSSDKTEQIRICSACTYGIRSVIYRTAEMYNVPLILWGHSQQEATQEMEEKALAALKLKNSRLTKLLNINLWRAEYYWFLQRAEFKVSSNNILRRDRPYIKNENIKEIKVFDYIPWDRNKIKKIITTELDWKKPENSITSWHTDCFLHAFKNYSYFKIFGCSKDCFGYCNMINSEVMTREEALTQEDNMLATYFDNIDSLLIDKIGISRKKADEILSG